MPAFSLLIITTLSACGPPPGQQGQIPGMAPPMMSDAEGSSKGGMPPRPPAIGAPPLPRSDEKLDSPVKLGKSTIATASASGFDTLETQGYTLQLASSIITAGSNPFLDRLTRTPASTTITPEALPDPAISAVPDTPLPVPEDPFETLSLSGVLYNPKQPMALLSLTTEGQKGTQMVRVGDVFQSGEEKFKVKAIRTDTVEVQRVGVNTEKKVLELPSIFAPASGTSGSTSSTGVSVKTPSAAAAATTENNAVTGNLSNIQQLERRTRGHIVTPSSKQP